MPLFDTMYYDQKWSLWDTWKSFGRSVRLYLIVAGYKASNLIPLQYRNGLAITTQKRRSRIITAGEG